MRNNDTAVYRPPKGLVKYGIGTTERDKDLRQIVGCTTIMERVRVQWDHLGKQADTGKAIMKQHSECCRYGIPQRIVGDRIMGSDHVDVDYHHSGKIKPRGTIKCNGLECSYCGGAKRREMAETLEMALQYNSYRGGENVFGTLTQQTSIKPTCIVAANKAMSDILRELNKWNTRTNSTCALFITQETLFSANRVLINVRGSKTDTEVGHYYHSHLHFILLVPGEDKNKKLALLEKIKGWWFRYIEKHGGRILDFRNKIMNERRAFRVEKDVNQDKACARYITKHLKSMELVYAQTKDKSKGLSLEQLKSRIHLEMGNVPAYISMLKTYYKCIKGRSRFKKTKEIMNSYVQAWKDRLDWLRTQEAYRQVIAQRKHSVLSTMGREKEILIVAHIKHAILLGDDSEYNGPTMFNRFGNNKAYFTQERENQEIFEEALEEQNVLYSGSFITLAEEVRAKEKQLYDNGIYSYVERIPGEQADIVLETVRIPQTVYGWLANNKILIPVLYRLRNRIKFGYDEPFYQLIKAVFSKVSSRMGEPQIVLEAKTKKVPYEEHYTIERTDGFTEKFSLQEVSKRTKKGIENDRQYRGSLDYVPAGVNTETYYVKSIHKNYDYPLFRPADQQAILKALQIGSCKEFQPGTIYYDGRSF